MSTYNLERVFSPRSIAIVGASPNPRSVGRVLLDNIVSAGFAGSIGVVNPKYREVAGRTVVDRLDRLDRLPNVPDLVVIATPPNTIPGLVTDAGRIGATGCIVVSAGLGQGPGSFAAMTQAAAREANVRLIGANCLGVLMPRSRLNASLAARMPEAGDLALVSQSGAIAAAMIDWGAERRVGFSAIASVGDELDVDVADLLDYFSLDIKTRAILLYIDAVADARKFMSAARAAARVKPVVVVKAGRLTQASGGATHTGSLMGSDAVYDAAFRRAGLVRVFDLRELFDCAETLARSRQPSGSRLGIMTNGSGIGALAVDRLVESGGSPAKLSEHSLAALDRVLPATWSRSHPVDVLGDADAGRYVGALEALLADEATDAVLVMNVQTAVSPTQDIASAVARVVTEHRKAKPVAKTVLAAWVGSDAQAARTFSDAGISNFASEDGAVRGFMHMLGYHQSREALMRTPPSLRSVPDAAGGREIVAKALAEGRTWLGPLEINQLLAAYGIATVPIEVVATAEQARASAAPILASGRMVALKILSRDIVYKSDVGGVRLNLASEEEVETSARDMLAAVRKLRPAARIEGLVVQPMIARRNARELIVGIAVDPTFGPVVMFGDGGTAAEVTNDKAIGLPPLDLMLAHDLIGRTRVAHLLDAYRDKVAVNRDEIARVLVMLAQLAADLPEVRELDVNPLMADEKGVLALDARVAVAPRSPATLASRHARLAIRPYPAEWEQTLEINDGWSVPVRPIRPEDEPAMITFHQNVSKEDLRLRFFAPMKEFTHAFIARLTQLDYARAMAFVALDPSSNDILGVVRVHSDAAYESAEYAVLVRSDMKGRGLGRALMRFVIAYAKSEGLQHLTGQVLRGNQPMLAMCRKLGFSVRIDPHDADLCEVKLPLAQ